MNYIPEKCRTFGFIVSVSFSFETVPCRSSPVLIELFVVQDLGGALYVKCILIGSIIKKQSLRFGM